MASPTVQRMLASALPHVARVRVQESPGQALGREQPMWELEDAVGMLPTAGLCRGLAPRHPVEA